MSSSIHLLVRPFSLGRAAALVAASGASAMAALTIGPWGTQTADVFTGDQIMLYPKGIDLLDQKSVTWRLSPETPGISLGRQPNGRALLKIDPGLLYGGTTIIATSATRQEAAVELRVTPGMPFAAYDAIAKVWGKDWLREAAGAATWSSRGTPFLLDPAQLSGPRQEDPSVRLVCGSRAFRYFNPEFHVGFGLPFTLKRQQTLGQTQVGERLTTCTPYARPDERLVRKDLTRDGHDLVLRDHPVRLYVESLTTRAELPNLTESEVWTGRVFFRGFYPLAGRPMDPHRASATIVEEEGKHGTLKRINAAPPEPAQDGEGSAATFVEPCGSALVGVDAYDRAHWPMDTLQAKLVVADRASHCIRCVVNNSVVTRFGKAGEKGNKDDVYGPDARFNSPTDVAAWPRAGGAALSSRFLVSDSGNHCLKLIDVQGGVSRLAGSGEPAHRDSDDPLEAQFNDPRGVAIDASGRIFVADAGNCAIRMIQPSGEVRTVARTGADGLLGDLRGLACLADGRLFATAGNRLVEVNPGNGAMRLRIGTPENKAGFLDCPPVSGEPELETGVPGRTAQGSGCLNEPWGLKVHNGKLIIADRRNHAVREYNPANGELRTLLGGPEKGGEPRATDTRWGLLRDGIDFPDERHGIPFAPCSITVFNDHQTTAAYHKLLVTTGSMLGVASFGAGTIDERKNLAFGCAFNQEKVEVGGAARLAVTVPESPTWPAGYFLRVTHGLAPLAPPVEGKAGEANRTELFQLGAGSSNFGLSCAHEGSMAARVTIVTHSGYSFQAERNLEVVSKALESKREPKIQSADVKAEVKNG